MLKPETETIWLFLKEQPLLAGFILLGGSALALHLRHRFSEDLDLAYPAERLPRGRLLALRRLAEEHGLDFQPNDDPVALADFANGGLDLLDYQQDFQANRIVKVSFFAPEEADRSMLVGPESPTPRLATLEELFRTKSLLSARRSRTRDWFDLYVLMSSCGFTMEDYHEAFALADQPRQAAIGLERLCSGQIPASDETFEPIRSDALSPLQLAEFFRGQRDAFERSEAARGWRERHP